MPPTAVLAFSGGLDTSFCVPFLIEKGYRVVTVFVDTGGGDPQANKLIEQRALDLGASAHRTHNASRELWDQFVVPFVMGGAPYQDQYPLLCSDRYAIAAAVATIAAEVGAEVVAHGCTAMGNDQVRFDHSLRCLTPMPVIAPIREVQALSDSPRDYEIAYLEERGHEVSADVKQYTINENLLGATISGSEIDRYEAPGPGARRLTSPPEEWPAEPVVAHLRFEQGVCTLLDDQNLPGPVMLRDLNRRFGACGVGRGIYTGDTVIGLKGRIVYEAPGLIALLTAHRALEELCLTKEQNGYKPVVARKWTDLVYAGFYYEPLREDLEAMILSTQANVSGDVVLEARGASVTPVVVRAERPLELPGAQYAQRASWSAADAEGFIKLLGNSSAVAALRDRTASLAAAVAT